MWFSVVCILIDNDTRDHSGQNLLWTHEAQPICSVRQSVLKLAQATYEMKASNSKGRYEKLAIAVHVL